MNERSWRVSSRADRYRQKAEETERRSKQAEEFGNSIAAETYRGVARKWRELAEKAERWGFETGRRLNIAPAAH